MCVFRDQDVKSRAQNIISWFGFRDLLVGKLTSIEILFTVILFELPVRMLTSKDLSECEKDDITRSMFEGAMKQEKRVGG